MNKFLIILGFCFGVSQAADLGVLYSNTDTNNTLSPNTLTAPNFAVKTNLVLQSGFASHAVQLNAAKQLVGALLTSPQQDILASWVGGTTTLNLGNAQIISGSGAPTNGTAYVQRILYINVVGTNLNDTYWGNYGTSWYAIASTNGGAITENQLNISDNTTANVTTNAHGLMPKLPGDPLKFFNGNGVWLQPPLVFADTVHEGEIPRVSLVGPTMQASGLYQGSGGVGQLELRGTNSLTVPVIQITNAALINRLFMTNPPAESLLRLNTAGELRAAGIGAGLIWNGVTLSATGGGVGSIGITGSPVASYVTYWSAPDTVTGNAGFTFDGTTLSLNGTVNASHYQVPTADTTGNLTSGTYTPTRTELANCDTIGTTATVCHYVRIGNQTTVSGVVTMRKNASGNLVFSLSLPNSYTVSLASNETLTGTATTDDSGTGIIYPTGGGGTKAIFNIHPGSTANGNKAIYFTFTFTNN